MNSEALAAPEKLIFRHTNRQTGRHIAVSPGNSSMRHLAYGRIILNSAKPLEAMTTGDRETGLICLSGEATVKVDGNSFTLGRYDSLYIPRDSSVQVSTDRNVDIAEFSAEVSKRYPLQVVRFRDLARPWFEVQHRRAEQHAPSAHAAGKEH